MLPGPGSAHAAQVHRETEAKPSSWWGDWLEVDSTRRPGRGCRIVSGQHRSTLDSSSGQHSWQISRFSPTCEPSAARDSLCSLSVSAWLWPRQLEATSGNSAKSSALGRRHSTHSAAPTTKPALKRSSVESTAEGSASRRVSFSDIADTREVEFSKEEKLTAPAESSLKPSDEAFAAFRVKPQFEETELPPSLKAHGSSARYHSAGHHQHHALAIANPAPAIDELPSGSSMAYVPLRTRASEVQGPAQSSRGVLLRTTLVQRNPARFPMRELFVRNTEGVALWDGWGILVSNIEQCSRRTLYRHDVIF